MLAELFPGFTEEFSGGGAPTLDYHDLSEVYFCIGGHKSVRNGALESGCARSETSRCSRGMTQSI